MARYAITNKGAAALNQLANNLLIAANNIIEANQHLEQATCSLYDDLGIYGNEIMAIIHHNRQTLNANREDIINLSQKVKKKAIDVENFIAMGLGDNSGSSTEPSNSNGMSGSSLSRVNYDGASGSYQKICDALDGMHVEYRTLANIGQGRSTAQIVSRLGGGDMTKGSCSSLALAYAGNKAGYDVLDFRDGESRRFFSNNDSILRISALPGVEAKIVNGIDDIACADQLLSEMKQGKEYYLATGQHASIVRLNDGNYEYLELQSVNDNGWHILNDRLLYERFGCGTNNTEYPNFLIDVDSLANCNEFLDLLGYINTEECNQHKGGSGHVR